METQSLSLARTVSNSGGSYNSVDIWHNRMSTEGKEKLQEVPDSVFGGGVKERFLEEASLR